MNTKIGVVGAQGYSGRELAKILLSHPAVKLAGVFTTSREWRLADELNLPAAALTPMYDLSELQQQSPFLDTLFLATPAEVSAEIMLKLSAYSGLVIDLSGAFRLHKQFAYGLSPWNKFDRSCKRIANPGCYATAILMSLLPLLCKGIIRADGIIIDAKSGISGAGRQANVAHLFSEIHNDFFPYKLGQHPHEKEIQHYCREFTGAVIDFSLVNYILPLHRGIHVTLYADPVNFSAESTLHDEIARAYDEFYADYPLLRHAPYQEHKNKLKHLKSAIGSAGTHISYQVLSKKIVIFTCIDNLLKGAAGQAVENLNQWLGLPLATGLSTLENVL